MAGGGGTPSNRTRSVVSIALAIVGAVLALFGAILFYARTEVIDERAFADHAAEAFKDDQVRELIATEVVVQLAERGSADLVAARPLLQSVVDTVIETEPFRDVLREAARQTNRLLFVRERNNVAFNVSDGLEVVRFALQSVSPKLAEALPRDIDLALVKLKRRDFARQSLEVADRIRVLGIIAPLLALLVLVASVVVAPDRRIGVLRAALAVAAAGAGVAIALLIFRARLLAGVIGTDELTDDDVRGAVGGIFDAFLGGLVAWGLIMALTGLVVAGAGAALDPERDLDPATRLRRRLSQRPRSGVGRVLRAIVAIGAGFVIALEPLLALQVVGLLAGAWLIYFGTGELLLMLQPPAEPGVDHEPTRRRALLRTGVAAAAGVAAIVIAVVVFTSGDGPRELNSAPRSGCNGAPELCDLRLNQVVFAGTHNSFSAADSGGWFIANQNRTIERQLSDGIRLLLLDPHWGVADARGRVRTDFEAEGRDLNRVAKALPPATLAAAQRLAGDLGVRTESGGEPDVFLCHTVCELGATRMTKALDDIRTFLEANPGEVLILFIEPYVPPAEIAKRLESAGLSDYLAELERGAPLPTLGELVKTNKRLVVLTERDADGSLPWYLDGFSFVQDTPLGATKVEQLSCELNRGEPDSPMLMLNQWADVFPPRQSANPPFQTGQVLLDRAHRCARERGLPANLIAVDFYDRGALIESVDELNRERIAAAERRMRR